MPENIGIKKIPALNQNEITGNQEQQRLRVGSKVREMVLRVFPEIVRGFKRIV